MSNQEIIPMSKREYMEQAWISINTRLPPDTYDDVLTLSVDGIPLTIPSHIARMHAEVMLGMDYFQNTAEDITPDRRITHWMPIYPPKGRSMWISISRANTKKKKKGRRKS